MAILLEIDNADNSGRVNYTRYLASPDRAALTLRDRLNLPALLDFMLLPADERFIPPRRGAYVRVSGLTNALPPGGPRIPGPLFTGYITSEPAVEHLGVARGEPVQGYRCQATSEEYLLNVKRIGALPPFLSQTAGAILRFLTEHVQPGRFDVTAVVDGALIPHFAVEPEHTWGVVARELAERAGCFYRVLDGAVIFQPIGSEPAGVAVDERDRHFRPSALQIQPLSNPILNDVTVVGAVEPQAWVREYFVGDGFTSRFPLVAPMAGAESAKLLSDDFTGAAIDTRTWQEADPASSISLFGARLNVASGTGALGETYLLAKQALELGGELELVHGEFEFVSPSTGILGGLYSGPALETAECIAGFEVSPIGSTTRLRALVGGAVLPLEVMVQPNHTYVLFTTISGDQPFRTLQTFLSLGASFGGISVASTVQVTLGVHEIDISNPALPVTTVLYQGTLQNSPAFALYAPINSADLHLAANFLQVTRAIQAALKTQKPGEAEQQRSLGFGIAAHDATITVDANRNQWALEFYEDTIPVAGERITLAYRSAGRAVARVMDSASIATEAALAGDSGVRAAVLREANPQPRTSAEAELAAQAFLQDHKAPRYEGSYSTWSRFAEGWPRSGALLTLRNPSRLPEFTALARSVRSEFRELAGEEIVHNIEFGEPSRLEDLLRHFAPPEGILDAFESLPTDALDSSQVGMNFVPDTTSAGLLGFDANAFDVDMGVVPPPGGAYEVRRSDLGWSTGGSPGTIQNLLGTFSGQTFQLARTARHQAFYIRPVATTGETSRYSSVIAIHYPGVPQAPDTVVAEFGTDAEGKPIINAKVELDESKIADVHAVELHDAVSGTVLARWDFGQLRWEAGRYHAGLTLDNSTALARSISLAAFAVNVLGEFSPGTNGNASLPVPAKPALSFGNATGQVLEVLLDSYTGLIVETQMQVIGPAGSFTAPAQEVLLAGQPQKFTFVATQSGSWGFRARRRDALGWSPWSNETQGQVPAQFFSVSVEFFRADELDPSIGAAVNGHNLLPNAEFFLPGIAGQEGIHAARYFALVNAAADGSELDYSSTTNEMHWLAGVNFASANPGLRSLLSNLGRLLNPGESVTLSVALRHTGGGAFSHAIRVALRSPGTPGYDQAQDIASSEITSAYRWLSVTFTLPSGQAVPADLSAEIAVVIASGQSLADDLYCDKMILNRGHRPAAFSLAPWDVLPLAWNSGAAAYDLPSTVAGGTPRSSDPGNAGLLSGTGTEDLDPDFTGRYYRLTA